MSISCDLYSGSLNVSSSDACQSIVHSLMCHRQGSSNEAFAQRAIHSLVRKLRDRRHELDALITAITTNGAFPTGCVTVPRTLDGRQQVAGRKGLPHVTYARIWRWPDLHSSELHQSTDNCAFSFHQRADIVCVNPYHYERVLGAPGQHSHLSRSPTTLSGLGDDEEAVSDHDDNDDDDIAAAVEEVTTLPATTNTNNHPSNSIIFSTNPGSTMCAGSTKASQQPHHHLQQHNNNNDNSSALSSLGAVRSSLPTAAAAGSTAQHQQQQQQAVVSAAAFAAPAHLATPYSGGVPISGAAMLRPMHYYSSLQQYNSGVHNNVHWPRTMPLSSAHSHHTAAGAAAAVPPPMMPTLVGSLPSPGGYYPSLTSGLGGVNDAMSNHPASIPPQAQQQQHSTLSHHPQPQSHLHHHPLQQQHLAQQQQQQQSAPPPTPQHQQPPPSAPPHHHHLQHHPQSHHHQQLQQHHHNLHQTNWFMPPPSLLNLSGAAPSPYYSFMTDVNQSQSSLLLGQSSTMETQSLPPSQQQRLPDYWCTISYFELDQQVGESFKVRAHHNKVVVDGYTDPSSPNRFCLGQLSNVHRSDQSEKSRLYIGQGVELLHLDNGDVWIRCLSKCSIFVQSYYLDREAGRNPWEAVHKIYPGASIKVFDIGHCYAQMQSLSRVSQESVIRQVAAVAGAATPMMLGAGRSSSSSHHSHGAELSAAAAVAAAASSGSHLDVGVDDLRRLCILRLSFVKGWGPDYPRHNIKETPCWIEIQLHRPLQHLDEVLQSMNVSNLKPTRHFFTNLPSARA